MTFKRVLVTGASGFIGCRVVEHLRVAHGVPVRAMIRDTAAAVRVARLDAEIVQADLRDRDSVAAAVHGCDAVVHCAYGRDGTARERRAITGRGTGALAEIARAELVRRFVHLSSVAVHGLPPPDGPLEEGSPTPYAKHPYIDGKIDSERAVADSAERGLQAVILRPANVYGPWSELFTMAPVRALRRGDVALVDGEGLANTTYVDNLVQAIVLALRSDRAVGETFLVSDGDGTTWRRLYEAYGAMFDPPRPVRLLSREEYAALRPGGGLAGALARKASDQAALRRLGRRVAGAVPGGRERVRSLAAGNPSVPSRELAALQGAQARVSIDKARSVLGYEPAVSFERGMRLTEQWLRYARLL